MSKRTAEQWRKLFAEQQASGLSQTQFCKEHKLCAKHFGLRRRQLTNSQPHPTITPPLIKVQRSVSLPVSSVSLRYQGLELHFHQVDPALIVSVAKQLL